MFPNGSSFPTQPLFSNASGSCVQSSSTPTPSPTPNATATPTAEPTPTPTAKPTPKSPANVIANGGFENGLAPWVTCPSGAVPSAMATACTRRPATTMRPPAHSPANGSPTVRRLFANSQGFPHTAKSDIVDVWRFEGQELEGETIRPALRVFRSSGRDALHRQPQRSRLDASNVRSLRLCRQTTLRRLRCYRRRRRPGKEHRPIRRHGFSNRRAVEIPHRHARFGGRRRSFPPQRQPQRSPIIVAFARRRKSTLVQAKKCERGEMAAKVEP